VQDGAVIGAPDRTFGEVPVAFVVLRPGASVSAAALEAHAARVAVGFQGAAALCVRDGSAHRQDRQGRQGRSRGGWTPTGRGSGMRTDEYERLDGLDLAALLHKREVSPAELMDCALQPGRGRNGAAERAVLPAPRRGA
jgi:acyl-CoA synthetase (AMP-forming)/AMP-acid ligase II